MIPSFAYLESYYAQMIDAMRITRASAITARGHVLLADAIVDEYRPVCEAEGVPIAVLMALNERESGTNFHSYLGNGDPLSSPTVHVPRNRGPFKTWPTGAIDALHLDGLDSFKGQWTLELACYACERFNGFGYLAARMHSPYDWAGSNLYVSGKFTGDGKFSATAVDQQIGCIPLIVTVGQIRPDLALPRLRAASHDPTPVPAPAASAVTMDEVKIIQVCLNKLGGDALLVVDGNYGRMTRYLVKEFQEAAGVKATGVASAADAEDLIKTVVAKPDAWNPPNIDLVQALLNKFGAHPKLALDGQPGAKTKAELQSFQDVNYLDTTGTVTAETIAAMQDKIRRGV